MKKCLCLSAQARDVNIAHLFTYDSLNVRRVNDLLAVCQGNSHSSQSLLIGHKKVLGPARRLIDYFPPSYHLPPILIRLSALVA